MMLGICNGTESSYNLKKIGLDEFIGCADNLEDGAVCALVLSSFGVFASS